MLYYIYLKNKWKQLDRSLCDTWLRIIFHGAAFNSTPFHFALVQFGNFNVYLCVFPVIRYELGEKFVCWNAVCKNNETKISKHSGCFHFEKKNSNNSAGSTSQWICPFKIAWNSISKHFRKFILCVYTGHCLPRRQRREKCRNNRKNSTRKFNFYLIDCIDARPANTWKSSMLNLLKFRSTTDNDDIHSTFYCAE